MERTGKPFVTSGQELNVGNAKVRTLLDRQKEPILAECHAKIKKHVFQENFYRRSVQKLKLLNLSKNNFIAFMQKNFNNFFMHSYYSKIRNYVKIIIKVSMKWKN